MTPKPMTAEDKKWRAESDARTLAEAEEIRADKNRLSMAIAAARRLYKEALKQANMKAKVANYKSPPRRGKKGG